MVYTPLCYVRKIEKFAFTHIIADILILVTVIVICVYNIIKIDDKGWGSNVTFINPDTWLNMIGFSVYSYEGIGIILPILDCTSRPEHYPKILLAVLTTVMVSYIGFAEFCMFTYGDELTKPLITSNLPRGSVFIYFIKLAFCFNLFFTYPLVIYPANMIIESYVYAKMEKSKKR